MKTIRLKTLLTIPSMLNIVGIAIATAAFYVIMSVADFNLTFNHDIDDYENIFQYTTLGSGGERCNNITRPIGEAIGTQMPSITDYGCLNPWQEFALYTKRNGEYNQIETRVGAISTGLLTTFSFKIVEGDISRFDGMTKLIVSRKTASAFNLHVGDYLKPDLQSNEELEIVAIFEDFENNSELRSFNCFKCLGDTDIASFGWSVYTYYYKAEYDPTQSITSEVVIKIEKSVFPDANISEEEARQELEQAQIIFYPLDQLRFAPEMRGHNERANKMVTYTLLILAIIIIAIAYINYLNFFVARMPQRIKSINTMKILGEKRTGLVATLVFEAVFYTLISLALASVIVWKVAPIILDGAIDTADVLPNYKIISITIFTAIITAIAVSIYPALHITNLPPALALKGNITQNKDSILRYILIGFQITASTALIIVAIFIHKNTEYIAERDLGFDAHNLLAVETSDRIAANRETVRNMLLHNSDIVDAAWTHSELVATQRFYASFQITNNPHEEFTTDMIFTSDNFLKFMNIGITDGRDFTSSDHLADNGVYIFNETARKKYDLTTENQLNSSEETTDCIVGFCNDFNFKPLHYDITPLALYIPGKNTPDYTILKHLYIRFADGADIKKVVKYVEATLAEADPDFPLMHHEIKNFQYEVMSSNYSAEEQLTKQITIFSFIAIFISVMGIFGIVLFETERRRKEIGIRRVNGATVWEILSIFNRKFLIIAAICSAIAAPIAYIAISKYFSGFVYNYGINAWIFILGILIVGAITAIIVTAASFKAANENPVDTLTAE